MDYKYHKGQIVRVRADLKVDERYPMENDPDINVLFVHPMKKFRGRLITIFSVGPAYSLTGGEGFAWSDGMLELPDGVCFVSLL